MSHTSGTEDYSNESFDELPPVNAIATVDVASVAATAASSSYDTEEFDPEPFEEEEVESVSKEELLSAQSAIIRHQTQLVQQQANGSSHNSRRSAHAAESSASSSASATGTPAVPAPAAPAKAKSSLFPSLTGLPSINSSGSALTDAGRAHFAGASIFGRGQAPKIPAAEAHAPEGRNGNGATATAKSDVTPKHRLEAYKRANEIWQAESLGIHAVVVSDSFGHEDSTSNASTSGSPSAPPNVVRLDGGRLHLWAGSLGTDLPTGNGSSNGYHGATANGSASSATMSSTSFFRAAWNPDGSSVSAMDPKGFNKDNFLHLFLEPFPSSQTGGFPSENGLIDPDGSPSSAASLPSCFEVKRLGSVYRLRILAVESSMPDEAEGFEEFVKNVHAINAAAAETNGASNVGQKSALDPKPVVTVFVAVEKLIAPSDNGASGAPSLTQSIPLLPLPPLPLDQPHTFWISTNQPGATCGLQFSSAAQAVSDGLSGPATDDDSFELTLELRPYTDALLGQVDVKDVRELLRGDESIEDQEEREEEDFEGRSTSVTPAAATSRKQKKQARAKAKKKQQRSKATSSLAAAAQQDPPHLVSVTVAAASPATAASNSSTSELVRIDFTPTPGPAAAAAVDAPVPSLVDLLATLASSPSTSLPSSILSSAPRHEHSVEQLTALTATIAKASGMDRPHAANTATAIGSIPPMSQSTRQNNLVRDTLDRRSAWPFSVDLSAMRLSPDSEGHVCLSSTASLDLLHNRAISKRPQSFLVGDHEVQLLRTVGLLCAWEAPRSGSQLNQPVLVSQTPFLSYHVQVKITRLDAAEAREREFDAIMG